jgi:hypothetical protein
MPIPVAAQSKAWVSGRSLAGIVGSDPAEAWISVSCECCLLSSRGLSVALIARPDKSYRMCGVSECDREASIMRRPWSIRGYCVMRIKIPEIVTFLIKYK